MAERPGSARIGVIADTHGLLRAEALAALEGVDRILHAGDIGGPRILHALAAIAPVTAVRGNNDHGDWAESINARECIEVGGVRIAMLHDVKAPDAKIECDVLVAGHSHKPGIERRAGVLYLNPGSAGPRRFSLPVSVAHLFIDKGRADATIVTLDVAPPKRGRQ